MSNISVAKASKIMCKTPQFIRIGLQRGTLPIGTAEKMPNSTKYSYYISPKLLEEYTGQKI